MIDDTCLRGKFIISAEDIKNLLPKEIKKNVEAAHAYVYVDAVKILWVIYLKDDVGTYEYIPFSKEINYNPYGRQIQYGLIYLWRTTQYLRDQYANEKVYSEYVCRPNHMLLMREIKKYGGAKVNKDDNDTKIKWFRAFP